jgi:hypothetical protein
MRRKDYKRSAELSAEAGFEPPEDPALGAILQGAAIRHPEYERVQAPALNIVVVFDGPIPVRPEDDEAYKRFVKLAEQRDLVGTQINPPKHDALRLPARTGTAEGVRAGHERIPASALRHRAPKSPLQASIPKGHWTTAMWPSRCLRRAAPAGARGALTLG